MTLEQCIVMAQQSGPLVLRKLPVVRPYRPCTQPVLELRQATARAHSSYDMSSAQSLFDISVGGIRRWSRTHASDRAPGSCCGGANGGQK